MKFILCLLALTVTSSYIEANVLTNLVDKVKADLENVKQVGVQIGQMVWSNKSPSEIVQTILEPHPELKKELEHLKSVYQEVQDGKSVQDIVKQEVLTHQVVKTKVDAICSNQYFVTIGFINGACQFLGDNAQALNQAAAKQRGFLLDLQNRFSEELSHLKDISQSILNGKNPIDIVTNLAQNGAKTALSAVCQIKLLTHLDFVAHACQFLDPTAPSAPAPVSAPAHQRKLTFGGFLNGFENVLGVIGNPADVLKNDIEGIKALVVAAKGKNKDEIVKAVFNLNLQNKLLYICKIPALKAVDQVNQACQIVEPLASIITAATGATVRRVRGVDGNAVVQDIHNLLVNGNLGQELRSDIEAIKNLVKVIKGKKGQDEIMQAVFQLNLQNKLAMFCQINALKVVPAIGQACSIVEPLATIVGIATAPAPHALRKRGINGQAVVDDIQKFLTNPDLAKDLASDIQAIKNLAEVIKAKKSPEEITQAVFKLGLQNKVALFCKINSLKVVPGVAQACQIIEPLAGVITVATSSLIPAHQRKFTFGDFVNNVEGMFSGGNLVGDLKNDIEAIKNLVNVIKDKKSPEEITQAVFKLNLQNKLTLFCKVPALKVLPPVQQACQIVEPLASIITVATSG